MQYSKLLLKIHQKKQQVLSKIYLDDQKISHLAKKLLNKF